MCKVKIQSFNHIKEISYCFAQELEGDAAVEREIKMFSEMGNEKFSASRSVSAQEAGKHRSDHPQPLLLRHRHQDTSLAYQQRRE